MTIETENKIIDMYIIQQLSCQKISKQLNLSWRKVAKTLHKYNIMRSVGRNYKYKCNDNFFKNIDTEEKAYWLGVLYADGNVSKNSSGTGQVFLSSKDKEWVQLFLNSINSTFNLKQELHKKYNKYIWKAHITSNIMFTDLCTHGCIPNKSLIITFPQIPNNLIRHFIRGYFDGDGTIGVYKYLCNSSSKTVRSGICSGSKLFLEELTKHIPTKYKTIKCYNGVYRVMFSVNDTLLFCNYIYQDATIFLKRKKNIIINYLQERRSTTIIGNPNWVKG